MAIISKSKKVFLLFLLVLVSFVLSAVKFISGKGSTSKAQAQCWTPPPTTGEGTTAGHPDGCVTTAATTEGTTEGTTEY